LLVKLNLRIQFRRRLPFNIVSLVQDASVTERMTGKVKEKGRTRACRVLPETITGNAAAGEAERAGGRAAEQPEAAAGSMREETAIMRE
jgi:hypothetical protein